MPEALKNVFFKRPFFDDLAAALKSGYPELETERLFSGIYDDDWEGRALKERIRHTTLVIGELLPLDYREALAILRRIAPALDEYGFEKAVFPDFVEVYGLQDWEVSLPALEQFTQQMSAEFAVRPFIIQDQPRMMAQMLAWADHESEHVRRLASEGCRPRLPWAMALPALKADPSPILPILERLKCDDSETVRRSVANNLNDIAKDNPQVVVDTLARWQAEDGQAVQWITQHALRTLVKQGHPGALDLLGFGAKPEVIVKDLTVTPESVALGESITFSFALESCGTAAQNLVIDFVLSLMRANGKSSQKVFKLTKRTLAPGETVQISKKFTFAQITTRKYYPGDHAVAIQINGAVLAERHFLLQS